MRTLRQLTGISMRNIIFPSTEDGSDSIPAIRYRVFDGEKELYCSEVMVGTTNPAWRPIGSGSSAALGGKEVDAVEEDTSLIAHVEGQEREAALGSDEVAASWSSGFSLPPLGSFTLVVEWSPEDGTGKSIWDEDDIVEEMERTEEEGDANLFAKRAQEKARKWLRFSDWRVDLDALRQISEEQTPGSILGVETEEVLGPNCVCFFFPDGAFICGDDGVRGGEGSGEGSGEEHMMKAGLVFGEPFDGKSGIPGSEMPSNFSITSFCLRVAELFALEVRRKAALAKLRSTVSDTRSATFPEEHRRDDVNGVVVAVMERRRRVAQLLQRVKRMEAEVEKEEAAAAVEARSLEGRAASLRRAALRLAKRRGDITRHHVAAATELESFKTWSHLLRTRRRALVADLRSVFRVLEAKAGTTYTIAGIPLPASIDAATAADDDEAVATAIGHTAHLILLVAKYLGVPLRFVPVPRGSRSLILDNAASQHVKAFPLFAKDVRNPDAFLTAQRMLRGATATLLRSQGVPEPKAQILHSLLVLFEVLLGEEKE